MFASGWGLHRGRGEGRDQAMGGDPAKAGNLVRGLKSNVQLAGGEPPDPCTPAPTTCLRPSD